MTPISPKNTVLLFGAGSSIPCGGPSVETLGNRLSSKFQIQTDEFDLQEAARLVEMRFGRAKLAEFLRNELKDLEPNSTLKLLPSYPWASLYTTNYDILIEKAFKEKDIGLEVVVSNADYHRNEETGDITLYKIHGCISKDSGFGDSVSMTITERDYIEHKKYREIIFNKLESDLYTKDVIVIGYSIRDLHLRKIIREIANINKNSMRHNNVIVYVFEKDEDRRALIEDLGVVVRFGGLAQFFKDLIECNDSRDEVEVAHPRNETILTSFAQISSIEIGDGFTYLPANAERIFNGKSAEYSDIYSGYTCERDLENQVISELTKEKFHGVITGAFGVGKTTICRRICWRLSKDVGFHRVYELSEGMNFAAEEWHQVSANLRSKAKRALLFVDDAQEHGVAIKRFMDLEGARTSDFGLSLLLSANHAEWLPIVKSKTLFSDATNAHLSLLTFADIERLVKLVDTKVEIRELVEDNFKRLPNGEKIERLKKKCQRDMFVCLKSIFSNDALDKIMLYEFDKLSESSQEIYRQVAALDTMGCHVHRQLIIRNLNLMPDQIAEILKKLEGILFEYELPDERNYSGIFRWSTRHRVISEVIRKYKYADEDKIFGLFEKIISDINPLIPIESRTLRSMCYETGGIKSIRSVERRNYLYRKLIEIAPNERLPWHNLIRSLLDDGNVEEADKEIKMYKKTNRYDPTIERLEIRSAIMKSDDSFNLPISDREASLLLAREKALALMEARPGNKYVYVSWADVEFEIAEKFGDFSKLDSSISRIGAAFEELLDPWLSKKHREYETLRVKKFGYPKSG